MNLELKKAIDQISKDKGLDRDMLVDTLEDAVRTSVIRKYGENIDVEVSYNDDTGEIQVHQFKIVVDDVADPDTEIDIEKARELDPSVQLDDEIGFPLKVTDLGRIATPNRNSSMKSSRTAWAKSAAASFSAATRAAGSSTSAGPKPSFPRKSRSPASITSAAIACRP